MRAELECPAMVEVLVVSIVSTTDMFADLRTATRLGVSGQVGRGRLIAEHTRTQNKD
jgi:hypothetical protein